VLLAIDALTGAGVGEIVVVTGHDADAVEAVLPEGTTIIRNPAYRDGQATSLAAGLHAIADDSEAAIVLMADQPGITSDHVRALIERFRETSARVVRLAFRDGPGPALLSREVYGEAGHLHGDTGARILIASHPDWVEDVVVDEPAPRDIDTPGDLPLMS
jgi:molybdenum cofactor cytidylyltransferase